MNRRDHDRALEFEGFELVQAAIEKKVTISKNSATKAASALGTYQSTLSRHRSGERKMVNDEILARLGLKKRFIIRYEPVSE